MMLAFPKKAPIKNRMSVEEYREMINNNPGMIPKKSMLSPERSKTMKAEMPESALQKYANDAIELKKWDYIRFDDWFMTWMRLNAPIHVQKHFFSQIGGKMADNFIKIELGGGQFYCVQLELKTQDKKGRAVGQLHGKQKRFAQAEGWMIARSPEQINKALEKIEKIAEKIKNLCSSIFNDIY